MLKSESERVDLLELAASEASCSVGVLQDRQQAERKLPLAKVEIQAQILGSVLDVELKQRFRNTYDTPLEAIYIFPLPGAAAVYQFELQIADRIIKGQVEERQAARVAYQEALENGHRSALMEQERDDVYTLQVGNIPAGESVQICLRYVQQLDYRAEGLYECRLPLVVAPRYMPGQMRDSQTGKGTETDTEFVPDASRLSPPRLAPGFDPEIDFSLNVTLDSADGVSELVCSQHATRTQLAAQQIKISLAQIESLNRDFVLRWRTASTAKAQHTLYYARGDEADQGFGLIELQAPAPEFLQSQRREVLFLLDRSGSMGEHKMAAAAQACERLLSSLSPTDAFAIQAFDDQLQWLEHQNNQRWIPADNQGKDLGRRFLQGIQARGGTELYHAISEGLAIFSEASHSLPVIVLLTDGQVGDESRILKKIQTEIGQALIHTIGIDTAVNDSFLKRLSQLGGGSHLSVAPREDISEALETIAAEIGFPILKAIQLDLPGLTPSPIPNLYAGRSLSLFFKGACPQQIDLQASNTDQAQTIHIKEVAFPALAQLWAHSRLQQLEDQYRLAHSTAKETLKAEMVQLSCEHQILCRLTAWLAIDSQESIADSDKRRQLIQPVETPADWQAFPNMAAPPPPMAAGGFATMHVAQSTPPPSAPMPSPKRSLMAEPRMQSPLNPKQKSSRGNQWLQQKAQAVFGKSASNAPLPPSPAPQYSPDNTNMSLNTLPEALFASIQAFLSTLLGVLDRLQASNGQVPDYKLLQTESQKLRRDLAESEHAERLPHTQRLLRQESNQLLQALTAGHIQGLEPLLARLRQQIEKVSTEIETLRAQENEEKPALPVWEQSI